ncbi:MAG: bifunctional adenosylcobinamide kinase/adenosylcobinamide-phosphate guanylyltransferase [Leptospirales bacterium]
MSLTLVTGGIRSGKSRFAEEYLLKNGKGPWIYLPTAYPSDPEMVSRIKRHQEERDARFVTLPQLDPSLSLPDLRQRLKDFSLEASVLLDGLGLLLSGLLMGHPEEPIQNLVLKATSFLSFLFEREGLTVIVTEESSLGGIPMTPLGRRFTDFIGEMNQMMAGRADAVYLVVVGCILPLKETSNQRPYEGIQP